MVSKVGNTLAFGPDIRVAMPGRILDLVELEDGCVAVVWDDAAATDDRVSNLELYSKRGSRLFAAQRRVFDDGVVDPFVGVTTHDGRLFGITYSGFKLEIDRSNGHLLDQAFVK